LTLEEVVTMRLLAPSIFALMLLAVRAVAQDISPPSYLAPPPDYLTPPSNADGFYNHGHAEGHDWYSKLNQPGTTYSCCNGDAHGGDCRPTRAFLGDDGFWHAQIDGRWVTVPSRAVVNQLAPDGNSHICASKGGYIFCFIGGSPKI
jgi:hypothetical protein